MKLTNHLIAMALTGAFTASMVACGDDEEEPTTTATTVPTDTGTGAGDTGDTDTGQGAGDVASNTIADIAAADDQFSTLVAAATGAGLLDELSDPDQTLTVFAPTNDAFTAALTALEISAEALLDNEPLLTAIVSYHVLPTEVPSSVLTMEGSFPGSADSLNALSLFYNVDEGTVEINGGSGDEEDNTGADVTQADIMADNGIIHVIDFVLLPPDLPTLAQYATNSGAADLGTLIREVSGDQTVADAVSLDLTERAAANIPQTTLFAPTDAAFSALDAIPTGDALTQVLQYHTLSGAVTSDMITAGAVPTGAMQAGGTPEIMWPLSAILSIEGNDVLINGGPIGGGGGTVITANLRAVNGVAHVVNGVLLPRTIAEIAPLAGLDTLTAAVAADTVVLPLAQNAGALTVFAPDNAAFAALTPPISIPSPPDNSNAPVLELHILDIPVRSGDLTDGNVPSRNGDLTIDATNTTVTPVGSTEPVANITGTDVGATNGIVHIIDRVMLPVATQL